MNIEEIDAALKHVDSTYTTFTTAKVVTIPQHYKGTIKQALKDAKTLASLKQELREAGDMPNTIYAGRGVLHYNAWDTGENGIDTAYRQYTRTTPTLKKIMEAT